MHTIHNLLDDGSIPPIKKSSFLPITGPDPVTSAVGVMLEHNNKRAQRALGRSPEEKVTGNSGANNREPQGHNLNNFGRGPFDDVIY